MSKSNGDGKPAISVIIVDSRSKVHPEWVEKAIDSVKEQTYKDIELIVLDNTQYDCTIGQMFNRGMELAEADWVFMLGDDDFLSPDYLASLKCFIDKFQDEETVVFTTFSTFFDNEKQIKSINTKSPSGCYLKEYFLTHKFDETLVRYIDVDAYDRLKKDNKKMKACPWHFGYFYRQHDGQISGRKDIKPVSKN